MNTSIQDRSWVEIDLAAFARNLDFLKEYLDEGQDFLQIVKADAYGHGAWEIAQTALKHGAVYLGVANLEEGKLLRIQGIRAPILILSPSLSGEISAILDYDLVPTVSDSDFARALSRHLEGRDYPIHLKLDTGMHRSGIRMEQAAALYSEIENLSGLRIEGIFSHFASSESDAEYCLYQEQQFYGFHRCLAREATLYPSQQQRGHHQRLWQRLQSGPLWDLKLWIDTIHDPAIAHNLQAVMSFKSTISQIKDIREGESVGYNRGVEISP
ncbi:MAG: alanine racemase [Candidatus Cloacimonetes bacterium]|nr:alanine racemase [Candidatus Cloacimonadota bacterium]